MGFLVSVAGVVGGVQVYVVHVHDDHVEKVDEPLQKFTQSREGC